MLITIANLRGAAVMSLQTGQPLAKIEAPIINPHDLKIVAFYVSGPLVDFSPAVLFSEDIREFGGLGAIVDSADQIRSPEEMVRLNEVMNYGFSLDGIQVVDERKRKLGKVENYTLDPDNFLVQQLYLKPTLVKSFSVAHLTVHRDQIIAIDNQKITVKTPTVPAKVVTQTTTPNLTPEFENPFRKPKAAVENSDAE